MGHSQCHVQGKESPRVIRPCQFPIERAERCVLALTREGDWVVDPSMGSGSSLIAAVRNQRRAAGCDKEEAEAALTRQRIRDCSIGTLRYRPLGRPVVQPTGKEKAARRPNDPQACANGMLDWRDKRWAIRRGGRALETGMPERGACGSAWSGWDGASSAVAAWADAADGRAQRAWRGCVDDGAERRCL